ncbi:MAG: methylated-DNA--[protein]-cysteine S-methyltransferase [Campylobacterales bacterium]|nr:methylated-DNA--[protein]-cysteine S-methyltransferase [Campylobacterales bacterium]HEO98489.1 methylated-DNA--[protein]-cysteine S-methyltransferase [Campylobacterota bacterium]
MKQIQIQYHKTPCTEFILGSFEGKICLLDYRYREKRESIDRRIQKGLDAIYIEQDNPLLQETRKALDEYFSGKRKTFDLPMRTVGTPFQTKVWEALQKIPYGTTATYAQLATKTNKPEAVRAVANAVGANALAIIIPCHRIIGSDGTLTGYAGGLALKQGLLDIETIL